MLASCSRKFPDVPPKKRRFERLDEEVPFEYLSIHTNPKDLEKSAQGYLGVSKNSGKTTKMDGENNRKPY